VVTIEPNTQNLLFSFKSNHWKDPSSVISMDEDSALRGGGYLLKKRIWDNAREIVSRWTGEELTECALYGIRVYKEGSILATHVDHMPLVSSAIILVAQDVDEAWPFEVYGHNGKAVNITMEPGDMLLYESHSVLHGRPFPLKGRFYATLEVHFEPRDHSVRHGLAHGGGGDVDVKYRKSMDLGQAGGHEHQNHGLPSYIVPDSEEAKGWIRAHPLGQEEEPVRIVPGHSEAHKAAQHGDMEALQLALKEDKDIVNIKDKNGWTPFHEAARSGNLEAGKGCARFSVWRDVFAVVVLVVGNLVGPFRLLCWLKSVNSVAGISHAASLSI
jgi:prolyl 4-hydroxylase